MFGWELELTEFDFDIVHVTSINNATRHCLIRLAVIKYDIENPYFIFPQEMITSQQSYPDTQNAFSYLQQGKMYYNIYQLVTLKRSRK